MSNDSVGEHLRTPLLIVVAGLPAAGKSTLISQFSRLKDIRVLSRDAVRNDLFAPCDWNDFEKQLSYASILEAAGYHLNRGRWVVIDGMPFSKTSEIERARATALSAGAKLLVALCEIELELASMRARIDVVSGQKGREQDDELVRRVANRFETISDPDVILDMTKPPTTLAHELYSAATHKCSEPN